MKSYTDISRKSQIPPLVGKLERVKIKGFKSLKEVELPLKNINILVGANGVGKSNFLTFFEMLGWIIRSNNLQEYIALKGGADDLLFNGGRITRSIECHLDFQAQTGKTEYQFVLQHTEANSLAFGQEEYRFTATNRHQKERWNSLGIGHLETRVTDKSAQDKTGLVVLRMLQNCTIYQFHDTSSTSPLKQSANVDDNVFLKSSGINLASILYDLKQNEISIYKSIIETIRKVLPDFGDFQLDPIYNKITLNWNQKNNDHKTFSPHLTSDGTLRFFALVTLLSMPQDRISNIILLDEPELGMHPYAIIILGSLIKRLCRQNKQVIVATQSPSLINQFEPEDIIVTEVENGATKLERLDSKDLKEWLEDYCVGDLWQKNVFGGNPE